MKKKFIFAAGLIAFSMQMSAQTIAADYKTTSNGNPISARDRF